MIQSFADVHIHFVFSTKNRERTIRAEWKERLYEYIGGIAKKQQCEILATGGVSDHIHLLISLSRTVSMSELMRLIKANSSAWAKDVVKYPYFAWQSGYSGFAVGRDGIEAVRAYIANQEEHHKQVTFQDEYRTLLREHGLEWDERYVWD